MKQKPNQASLILLAVLLLVPFVGAYLLNDRLEERKEQAEGIERLENVLTFDYGGNKLFELDDIARLEVYCFNSYGTEQCEVSPCQETLDAFKTAIRQCRLSGHGGVCSYRAPESGTRFVAYSETGEKLLSFRIAEGLLDANGGTWFVENGKFLIPGVDYRFPAPEPEPEPEPKDQEPWSREIPFEELYQELGGSIDDIASFTLEIESIEQDVPMQEFTEEAVVSQMKDALTKCCFIAQKEPVEGAETTYHFKFYDRKGDAFLRLDLQNDCFVGENDAFEISNPEDFLQFEELLTEQDQ